MNYLLDTNACIEFLNGTSQKLIDTMQSHAPSELAICSVVKAELLFGAKNRKYLYGCVTPFRSRSGMDPKTGTGAARRPLDARGF